MRPRAAATPTPSDATAQTRRRPPVRAARLVDTFGSEALAAWHGCGSAEEAWDELLSFGECVLEERFSCIDDVVSRVLGGGVGTLV